MMKQIRIKTYDEKIATMIWHLDFFGHLPFQKQTKIVFRDAFCEIAMKIRYRFLSSSL